MRLLFLGSGSAFTLGSDNFQSNMLLTSAAGRRLLIDCGSDIRFSLSRQGLSPADIDDIYISHLHADHVGGLEYLGFTRLFAAKHKRPRMYVQESLVGPLWEHALRGGMGITELGPATLEDYFDVRPVNGVFDWEGARLHLVATRHVLGGPELMSSFGILLTRRQHTIYLTTDTMHAPEMLAPHYRDADLIFHDCETAKVKSGVHAHFDDLAELPPDIRRKMWLYHYQPGPLPDSHAFGFAGFVAMGQVFPL